MEYKQSYDMPEPEFWHLLDEAGVHKEMAKHILTAPIDMTETLYQRALHLTREARIFGLKAWDMAFEKYPEIKEVPMVAQRMTKTVMRKCV